MIKVPEDGWSIAAVERDTGIGRDTLRIWERRYGFPKPERNSKGERIYPECQVRRLQLIRRLMDRGRRPGYIVGLDESRLLDLANAPEPGVEPESRKLGPLLEAVHRHEIDVLYALLADARDRLGLRRLILEIVAPAARAVGNRWATGEMQVFEEHLFTRTLSRFLDTAASGLESAEEGNPTVCAEVYGFFEGWTQTQVWGAKVVTLLSALGDMNWPWRLRLRQRARPQVPRGRVVSCLYK